ncbi:MAG: extracellular solute-binding protein [bacterium]|nr:extracellular solute-binding protein [bacterium]
MQRAGIGSLRIAGVLAVVLALAPVSSRAGTPADAGAAPVTLTVFAAGTLAAAFTALDRAFEASHPNVTVQPQFGGSVKMVKHVTELHEIADVVATADANVIPKYMYAKPKSGAAGYADWYIGFATNEMTFVYTPSSKYAGEIGAGNWYQVLARPGVAIGRSNPDTDPSGYQTLLMLELAERYYHRPGLARSVLANAPAGNVRDTETELLPALQSGQIDYLAIYRSEALRLHLDYLRLPPQVALGDARYASFYRGSSVTTANGAINGKPIVYAVTIPSNAAHAEAARAYIAMLLSPAGRRILEKAGFTPAAPGLARGMSNVPSRLRPLVRSWPSS